LEENKIIEQYYLLKNIIKIEISFFKYKIIEPLLNDDLRKELNKLLNYVIFEDFYLEGRNIIKDFEKAKVFVKEKIKHLSLWEINILAYYLLKELTYKDLLPLFIDPAIEDITTKENSFIHIYHDKYGWLKTNIFLSKEEAEKLTSIYAEKAYTFVSLANPFGEGILPNKDRFAAIFRLEESGFTIRRFKKKKFSIIDIINYGTIDIKTAAYLWLIIENPVICKLIINGPTGSGKTTFLNAILNFIPVNKRIVAIEERVSELNIPLDNYFVIITDSSNPRKTAFQALVNTLRQRPDYIVVGEIRGKETKIFFQALNTGHAGLTTFHSKNIYEMINRLTSQELGIEEKVIHSLKTAIFIGYQGVSKRKVYSIYEITEDDYIEVAKYNSVENRMEFFYDKTEIFQSLQEVTGLSISTIKQDYLYKMLFLYYLKSNGIREKEIVDKYFYKYYTEPYKLAKEILYDLIEKNPDIPNLKLKEIKKLEKFKNPYSAFKEIF
jgi:flagellar protein FlaI